MEDTLMTTATGEENDIMLPDGWSEGDDIFNPDSWTGGREQTDEAAAPDGEGEETDGSSAENDALTMGNEDGGEEQSAAGEDGAETPDGEEQTAGQPARILELKVNHEVETVDIAKMSDEELISHIQKSRAFDASREAENKRRYREVYQEQIEAGMTEAAARMIAAHEVGGKYSLEDETAPTAAAAPARDIASDVAQLKAQYPDFREVPDEVARAYAKGVPLLTAYLAYRDAESNKAAASLKKENAVLKKENAVLKQNAASAVRAPVRGVTGGGKAQAKADPMLAAFIADDW